MYYSKLIVERQNDTYTVHAYNESLPLEGPMFSIEADVVRLNGYKAEIDTRLEIDGGPNADVDVRKAASLDHGERVEADINTEG